MKTAPLAQLSKRGSRPNVDGRDGDALAGRRCSLIRTLARRVLRDHHGDAVVGRQRLLDYVRVIRERCVETLDGFDEPIL
jgi:hypothetical protein